MRPPPPIPGEASPGKSSELPPAPPGPSRPPFPWPPRLLLNVLLAGLLLRLLALGYWSIWLDEGATWSWAVLPTWRGTVFAEANHPPVWWVVTRLWIEAFGDSEAALRAPAALVSVLSMGLAWLLAVRLLDPAHQPIRGGFPRTPDDGRGRTAAAWATGIFALSSFLVEYAQEARMYPALLLETLALCLLYLRWLDRQDRLSLSLYALVGALALYTHYFGVWPIVAHAAHALWLGARTRRQPEPVRPLPFLGAAAAAGVLFLPWFGYLVSHYDKIAHIAPEPLGVLLYVAWRMGAGPGLVVTDRLRQQAGPEALMAEEWPTMLAVVLLWLVPLALGAIVLRRRPGLRSFVAANVLVPVVLLVLVYSRYPLIHERRLLFLAPWAFLLVALALVEGPRVLRLPLRVGVALLTLVGIVAYHGASDRLVPEGRAGVVDGRVVPDAFLPPADAPLGVLHGRHPYGREPWRQAHEFVQRFAKPGDLVVLHPWYVDLAWDYYAQRPPSPDAPPPVRLEAIRFPGEALPPEEIATQFGADLAGRRRVFLVLAHEETTDPDYYAVALRLVLDQLWKKEGAAGVHAVGPVLFHLSWGVRVAVYTRIPAPAGPPPAPPAPGGTPGTPSPTPPTPGGTPPPEGPPAPEPGPAPGAGPGPGPGR